jgi:hypothetical protein
VAADSRGMSERTRGLLLLAAFLLLGAALYRVVGNSVGPLLAFAITSGYNAIQAAKRREQRQTLDNLLSHLRALGHEARAQFLGQIAEPKLRAYLEVALTRDGSDERAGDVERFPFSRTERRRAALWYWAGWASAALCLGWAAVGEVPRVWRGALLVPAALGAVVAWLAARRQRRLSSVVEVTPFRLTEAWPDGARRTVLFNRYLELEHRPKERRLLLRPGGAEAEAIALDYDRLGFHRLMELVVRNGGFKMEDDEAAAT